MKKQIIFTLAKKEFFSYINNPLAYTIIVPFLLLSIFLYTRQVFVTGEASLRPYFDLLPWFLLFLGPALSMKLITEEYKSNTLELIFAHPISEITILLGKLLGATLFYTVILLLTLSLPLTLFIYSKVDPGQILGQYLGAFFLGICFLSLGLSLSCFTKNAISAFLLSASIGFLFLIIGLDFIALLLPYPLNLFAGQISLLNRTENLARGLLDFRDIVYFLTLIAFFLTLGVYKLSERKLAENKKERQKLKIAFLLILGIGILTNAIFESYPLRLDLTFSRLFTLSTGTKQTLKNLPDIVQIKVYASRTLPTQMQLTLREIIDLLKDYERLTKKIRVQIKHPDLDPEAENEARRAGIEEVTFNKIGGGKFEVQTGFLGIAIIYGEKSETLPFITHTSDLEYQLTRRIRKITEEKEKTIGLHLNGIGQNRFLRKILETQYKIVDVGVGEKEKTGNLAALLVIDRGEESTASNMIKHYLDNYQGKLLLLVSGVTVNPQILNVTKSRSNIPSFLSDFGITLNHDLVYDLELNELLTFGSGNTRYLLPYPFWVKAIPKDSSFSPLTSVKSLTLAWPSSLKIEPKEGIVLKELFTTGENGGNEENNFNISPSSLNHLVSRGKQILGVRAEKKETKVVVVSSPYLADDQFLENNQDNLAFISNTIDWLAQEKDLAAIPAKTLGRAVFAFRGPTDFLIAQFGNLFLPPLIVILFAIFYLRRRKILTQRNYGKTS